MKRRLVFGVAVTALGLGASPTATGFVAASGAASVGGAGTVQDDIVDLLRDGDGVYSKHGWNHYGPGHFTLDATSGVLTTHGGMGILWFARRQYANFVLELEFMAEQAYANSGVFLRVPGVPVSDDYIYRSFEVQIDESTHEGIHQTGAAYDAEAPSVRAARPPGEWNRYRITFDGDHMTVVLNDETVVDWDAEPRGKVASFAASGYVGLQNHDDSSTVHFRNVTIRELP